MAVRVSKDHGIISQDFGEKTVVAKLFADSKEDVTTDIIDGTLENKPEGYTLDAESYAITADGDIAMLDSTGEWHWVGEEEDAPVGTLSLDKPSLNVVKPIFEAEEVEPSVEESEPLAEDEQTDEDDMR